MRLGFEYLDVVPRGVLANSKESNSIVGSSLARAVVADVAVPNSADQAVRAYRLQHVCLREASTFEVLRDCKRGPRWVGILFAAHSC